MTISLTDLCLEMDKAASSAVIVAGVYSIEVQVTDKLQLDNSSLAFVRVLDSRQLPFPVDQLRWVWSVGVVIVTTLSLCSSALYGACCCHNNNLLQINESSS